MGFDERRDFHSADALRERNRNRAERRRQREMLRIENYRKDHTGGREDAEIEQHTSGRQGIDGINLAAHLNDDPGIAALADFAIVWEDGTSTTLARTTYDTELENQSIEFGVTGSTSLFDKTYSASTSTTRYDAAGSSQTVFRLVIRASGALVSAGGVYRAEVISVSGNPVAVLTKES